MKFLDAKRQQGASGSATAENKMQPGTRSDQGGARSPSTRTPAKDDGPRGTTRPEVLELADELGLDITTVTGTGKGGSITIPDVRKAAAARDSGDGNGAGNSTNE